MFDSSVTTGQPITFGVDGVIPGWTEGLQMMVEGEKRRFWIPARLAYEGVPSRPQGTLVFDVELIKIES
jgi:peptidylprolyl isomerase